MKQDILLFALLLLIFSACRAEYDFQCLTPETALQYPYCPLISRSCLSTPIVDRLGPAPEAGLCAKLARNRNASEVEEVQDYSDICTLLFHIADHGEGRFPKELFYIGGSGGWEDISAESHQTDHELDIISRHIPEIVAALQPSQPSSRSLVLLELGSS